MMTTRRLFAAWWLMLACSLGAVSAGAQPVEVRKALAAGQRAATSGKWTEALAAYRRADGIERSATTASRVADALFHLSDPVAAHDAYRKLLDEYGKMLFANKRKQAEQRLAELGDQTGLLTVRVSESAALVTVDEQAVGSSPLTDPLRLAAGKHRLTVRKDGFAPFDKTVMIEGGGALSVDTALAAEATEPPAPPSEAAEPTGRIEVRIADEQGEISIDGRQVGEGSYQGELPAGEHRLRVTRKGYRTVEQRVRVEAGKVRVETVQLRKAAAGDEQAEWEEGDWTFDGLYGGLVASYFFQPAGTGNTLEVACDTTGASSCDAAAPTGGGFGGYVGYAFAPVGIELLILGSGDATEPSANFDGVHGSDINPLVAQPARDEQFIIGRFGGGGAVRARLLFPIDRFRITGAAGLGLSYKYALLGRESTAVDGATSKVSDDGEGYLSPALSFELGGQVRLAGTVSLALGIELWLEHAGDALATAPQSDVHLLRDGGAPQPQATPAYDMASGPQLLLGPYLGAQLGP